jgi:hypothetical protein
VGRKSSLAKLPRAVKDEVDRLIREEQATIDEIVAHLRELGHARSRSAVGRYKKSVEQVMGRYREAQEIAGVWVTQLGKDPNSDVGRLLAELLKTVAFTTMAEMGTDEKAQDPRDIMFLAKALGELERAQTINVDRELKIRREVAEKAAAVIEKAARAEGLSAETIQRFRRDILGVAA